MRDNQQHIPGSSSHEITDPVYYLNVNKISNGLQKVCFMYGIRSQGDLLTCEDNVLFSCNLSCFHSNLKLTWYLIGVYIILEEVKLIVIIKMTM